MRTTLIGVTVATVLMVLSSGCAHHRSHGDGDAAAPTASYAPIALTLAQGDAAGRILLASVVRTPQDDSAMAGTAAEMADAD